jgi:hypothetical protein
MHALYKVMLWQHLPCQNIFPAACTLLNGLTRFNSSDKNTKYAVCVEKNLTIFSSALMLASAIIKMKNTSIP